MKIAILGFAREGQSIYRFLKRTKNKGEIWILDANKNIKVPPGIKTQLGENYLNSLDSFDLIFRSPGIPYNLPQIQKAIKKGVEFSSATKLFFEKAKGKIIGVTGTKGKGTTSTLIYKILKMAGKDVFLIGNIGKPCLDILPKLSKNSYIVFELSSFQLQDMSKSPTIAIVLGVFPDHLDKHKNFQEYLHAKINIAKYQKSSDLIFYFPTEKYSKLVAHESEAQKTAVNTTDIFEPKELKIKGPHNLKNATMAVIVAEKLGINKQIIHRIVTDYRGLKYRLEFSGTKHGISFYNDSASTNPESTAAAIMSFQTPQILIAGGKDKELNYKPLAIALKKSSVKQVFLFGENKNKILSQIKNGIPIELHFDLKSTLEKAVKVAYNGDTIVFSPGSASFDMFKDYTDRGIEFKKLVDELN